MRNSQAQPPTPPGARAEFHVIVIVVLVVLAGIVLGADGRLFPIIISIAGGVAILLALVIALLAIPNVPQHFADLWRKVGGRDKRIAGLLALVATITVVAIMFNPFHTNTPVYYDTSDTSPTASTASATISPTATASATASASATSTPGLTPVLQQPAPGCNNPAGVIWDNSLPGTMTSCTNSGLLMQQTSSRYYAESNLDSVNNTFYSQIIFRACVQAQFQNPRDTNTWAAIIVQTPSTNGVAGGSIFALNPTGQWQLQQVASASSIPLIGSGTVAIQSSDPITLCVTVRNGLLSATINGQQVGQFANTPPSAPSVTGLMVQLPDAAPSSLVLFSNFELDQ
jgi:hypothetical protein